MKLITMQNNSKIRNSKDCVILARVSEKNTNKTAAIKAQLEICRKYAQKHDYNVTDMFCFASTNQNLLTHMLDYFKANENISTLIVPQLDRLSRKNETLIDAINKLSKMGIIVYEATNNNMYYFTCYDRI